MDSGCHKLSENIWLVWSIMSYIGDMEGCHACGQRTTKCEDRARILETDFAIPGSIVPFAMFFLKASLCLVFQKKVIVTQIFKLARPPGSRVTCLQTCTGGLLTTADDGVEGGIIGHERAKI